VTSPDQKPDVFLLNDFPLGQEHIPVETHPRQKNYMPEQTFAIVTNQCVTADKTLT
jgi:hypothetical protein